MSEELKPCPFCGNSAATVYPRTCDKDTPYNPRDRAFPIVRCGGCGAEAAGKDWKGADTAIAAWNTRAVLAPIVPQGWKLVPMEPTPEMVRAADDELMTPLSGMSRGSGPVRVYRAMLAASPAPAADGVETNDGGRDA